MTKQELDNLKTYFEVLSDRMKERDEDCADPKTAVDKGYSLAVTHMNREIEEILGDLTKQISTRKEQSLSDLISRADTVVVERLTTNKPVLEMTMTELAYNSCYVKDGITRYRDYEQDVDARELARRLYKIYEDEELSDNDDVFDDVIREELQYDIELYPSGLIALFYRNLWAMADLRERLKAYEDTNLTPEQMAEIDKDYRMMCEQMAEYKKLEEQWLPCKAGDTVYLADNDFYFTVVPVKISQIVISEDDVRQYNGCFFGGNGNPEMEYEFDDSDFEKRVFLSESEAQEALERMVQNG